MHYACPNCQCDLAKVKPAMVPLEGARKFLPLRTAMACPACGTRLRLNQHPLETRIRRTDALLMVCLVAASLIVRDPRLFYAGIAVGGITEMGLWLWSRRSLRSWRRYAVVA